MKLGFAFHFTRLSTYLLFSNHGGMYWHRNHGRYVSRASTRDNSRHVILSAATVRPAEFAAQLNVSLMNGWGIVRTIVDMCMKHPDGKYLLIKDPNKASLRHI
jgi:hypothetical protein